MSETMNKISKDSIRGQMNLLFAMMKFLSTVLDLALENQMACDTINSTAEAVFEQAAVLYRDVSEYTTELSRNTEEGDDNEKNIRC